MDHLLHTKSMRRRDREVLDSAEVFGILSRCDTIRIGIHGEMYPYVVPVSFGAEMINGQAVVYFHGASQGLKYELLARYPNVCVEGDIFIRTETTGQDFTTRYESFIGFGQFQPLKTEEDIRHGLRTLIDHYGYNNGLLDRCKGLTNLFVGKIELVQITGKRNLPNLSSSNRE